jgi:pimeloyl-ACP methyl ester carboxylesterase
MFGRHIISTLALSLPLLYAPRGHAEDRYFTSNGVKIRYIVEGKGEPVLLIHGFTANIEMQWTMPGIIKALAHDYQVIAFDNRGHGKSGKPHDAKQYGMEMVEDPIRLLDHLKIKRAHVVGYSMGGLITGKLLTVHPDRLLSATMGGAGGLREVNKDSLEMQFFQLLGDSLAQGKGFGPLVEALTPPGQPKPTPEQIKQINTLLSAFNDTKAMAAVVQSWKDLMIPDANLRDNKIATLAIVGSMDPLKRGIDALEGHLARMEVVVLPGDDHISAFADRKFVTALQEFLSKHSEAPKSSKAAAPAGR